MLGAVLPLISHTGIAPDRLAGTHLSYLYAGNILGSVLGSFLTGFVLLDLMSIQTIAAALVSGWLCHRGDFVGPWWIRGGALAGSAAAIAGLTGALQLRHPGCSNRFYEKLLLTQRFTPSTRFRVRGRESQWGHHSDAGPSRLWRGRIRRQDLDRSVS